MKKLIAISTLAVSLVILTGCVGTTPVSGFKTPIVAEFKAPLSTQVKELPKGAQLKVGRATSKAYFSLVSSGDMSIETAKRNGGIKTVTHIDYEYKNIGFFMYQEMTVIVYGY